jgi:hypothetical protein
VAFGIKFSKPPTDPFPGFAFGDKVP